MARGAGVGVGSSSALASHVELDEWPVLRVGRIVYGGSRPERSKISVEGYAGGGPAAASWWRDRGRHAGKAMSLRQFFSKSQLGVSTHDPYMILVRGAHTRCVVPTFCLRSQRMAS